MFTFVDDLRDDAGEVVRTLQRMGKTVILMTGDCRAAARQVAELTGIVDYRAQMSPQDKMAAVQDLQSENAAVLMVGIGVTGHSFVGFTAIAMAAGYAASASGPVPPDPRVRAIAPVSGVTSPFSEVLAGRG